MSRSDPTPLAPLQERQLTLWIAAVLLYGVGDTATTTLGLRARDVAEAGPIAAEVIDSLGVGGLVLQKIVFFAGCAVVWRLLRSPGRVAVPTALAVAGGLITGWNLFVLFG